jgi:hypothetical protein
VTLETEQQGEREKEDERARRATVEVEASYQPTTTRFEKRYPRETTLAPVKVDVMAFFQVTERQVERKVYTYHLFLAGQPQADLGKTLGAIAGEERELKFQLVEQIVES